MHKSENRNRIQKWKVQLMEDRGIGFSTWIKLQIVESGTKHRRLASWNCTPIECFGVKLTNLMNMKFRLVKKGFVEAKQASIKFFALFRQLGAAPHLPTWVTQDLASIRLSKVAAHAHKYQLLFTHNNLSRWHDSTISNT